MGILCKHKTVTSAARWFFVLSLRLPSELGAGKIIFVIGDYLKVIPVGVSLASIKP
nr:hypothetical protein [uncultured bacterium]